MINLSEVYFGINRPHVEVGHKNTIIFSYKNHLDRLCIKGKQFISKDLQHNFMQFLVQKLVIT
jgi:hypothetical protein